MRQLDVVYSPICEASTAFVGLLKEWLQGTDVRVLDMPFDATSRTQAALYGAAGILVDGRMTETCFVDVFSGGTLIDSVPLRRDRIFRALGLSEPITSVEAPFFSPDTKTLSVEGPLQAGCSGQIEWIPITSATVAEELSMCLCHYPHGNPPARFHAQCMARKQAVYAQAWETERCAGIYARYEGQVIGLLEVLPREILRQHGFMTGSTGPDAAYLTVGCYEVAYGMPRVEVLDALMRHLLQIKSQFTRPSLEGIGVPEWPDGFTPFWVYDKYGFARQETLAQNKHVLQKPLS